MPPVLSSAKALIKHDDKYLFLREDLPQGTIWDLPGGKIEFGESPEETIVREVKEEVYFEIKILKSIGVWWFFPINKEQQIVCHTYLCEPTGNVEIDLTKNPADEHFSEYRWVSKEEVLTNPEYKLVESLRKLVENLA